MTPGAAHPRREALVLPLYLAPSRLPSPHITSASIQKWVLGFGVQPHPPPAPKPVHQNGVMPAESPRTFAALETLPLIHKQTLPLPFAARGSLQRASAQPAASTRASSLAEWTR